MKWKQTLIFTVYLFFVIGDKKLEGAAEENAFITAIREALAGDAVAENNSEEKVHSDDSDKKRM